MALNWLVNINAASAVEVVAQRTKQMRAWRVRRCGNNSHLQTGGVEATNLSALEGDAQDG